jgi:hypothetical protein
MYGCQIGTKCPILHAKCVLGAPCQAATWRGAKCGRSVLWRMPNEGQVSYCEVSYCEVSALRGVLL